MSGDAYYITTAIAYPNGAPHIGHAYEMIATDAIARFRRLQGRDVYFLTGTDEHGIKMVQTAAAQGLPVRDLADENAARFKALAAALNLSNDDFIRTTEDRHHRSSQAIWRRMLANGDIYQDTYEGWYSVRDEAYFDESELTEGEGGEKLAPSGAPVAWVEEPSFFFRLSAYQDRLLALYRENPDFIAPRERLNEIVSFVRGGLQDLSISRTTFDWGIPVPDAPGHVMYVWVDALTNYITGVGFPDTRSDMFQRFWPAAMHVIGKDIVRFHAVFWPAFLLSAGLPVQHRVFAHGFLTVDGKKMSKSLGNVIDPFGLVEEFGADPLRFFLLREVSFGQDGDFSRDKLINRSNADLANNLGNLAQRSLSMIQKNFAGALPPMAAVADGTPHGKILKSTLEGIARIEDAMAEDQIHVATEELVAILSAANLYFADQAPWALKAELARMGDVLHCTADILRRAAIVAQAFIPESAARILDQLAVPHDKRAMFDARLGASPMKAGERLPPPEPVFQRFERTKAD